MTRNNGSSQQQQGATRDRQGQQGDPTGCLDLLFVHDTTQSQQPYIEATIKSSAAICHHLRRTDLSREECLRVGLLTFRDYPEEENGYVTKSHGGFSSDVDVIVKCLKEIRVEGGGDLPEAVATALQRALEPPFSWREYATKIIVLITDAPPHGIGETICQDRYRGGDPEIRDPLESARIMAEDGITLFVIACEPALSNDFEFAHDFYTALAQITGGQLIPFTNADILAPIIVGSALYDLEINRMTSERKEEVSAWIAQGKTEEEIVDILYRESGTARRTITRFRTDPIYCEPEEAAENVEIWMRAENIKEARDRLRGRIPRSKRVPKSHIAPPGGWKTVKIPIIFKNYDEFNYIQFLYFDDNGAECADILPPNGALDAIEFSVNKPYMFYLKCGSRQVHETVTFSQIGTWNLAKFIL